MYDTSPRKIFVPKLYTMAIPILTINNTGTRNESINIARTTQTSNTATSTYIGVSFSDIDLVSVTTADIPAM